MTSKFYKSLVANTDRALEGKSYFDSMRKEAAAPKGQEILRHVKNHPHLATAAAGGLIEGGMDAYDAPPGYRFLAAKRGLIRGSLKGGALSLAHSGVKHLSKTSGVGYRDALGNAYDRAKDLVVKNKAGILGAGVFGGAAYLSFKKGKKGTSAEQRQTSAALRQMNAEDMEAQSKGLEPSVGRRLRKAFGHASAEVADALSEKPLIGAALAVPTGFFAGSAIANEISKFKRSK